MRVPPIEVPATYQQTKQKKRTTYSVAKGFNHTQGIFMFRKNKILQSQKQTPQHHNNKTYQNESK